VFVLHRQVAVIATLSLLIPEAESGIHPASQKRCDAAGEFISAQSPDTAVAMPPRVLRLDKTLFASIGPNLPCRGHQLRCRQCLGALPRWKSIAANWAE